MKRTLALMAQIAPPAPPCFGTRDIWVEYLASAAASQKQTKVFEMEPVLLLDPPRVNPHYRFCSDCNAQHSLRMEFAGRCKPDHLKEMALAGA